MQNKNISFIPNPVDRSLDDMKAYENQYLNMTYFAMSHGVHRGVLKKGKFDEEKFDKLFNQKKSN